MLNFIFVLRERTKRNIIVKEKREGNYSGDSSVWVKGSGEKKGETERKEEKRR